MESQTMSENNYEEKLKKELEKLADETQNISNKLTLEKKLIIRCQEIKHHLIKNESNMYKYFIMTNSLFFIKDNQFKTDKYFSLISNNIYKYFYELSINPCQEKFVAFQRGFENLEYGADIIFYLSSKICSKFKIGQYDLFFSIVIKDNNFRLGKLLKLDNITLNHEKIINKLVSYKTIKSNWHDVRVKDAYNFFIEAITNPQNDTVNGKIITTFNQEKKDKDKPRDMEIKTNSTPQNTSTQSKKNEQNTINDVASEKEGNQKISSKENIHINNFLDYLKEQKKIYEKICETPVLDYLINDNGELKQEYFRYKENKDSFVDHIYENLGELIYNLKNGYFTDDSQGYFCYKDEAINAYVESLYSIIDLNFLFDKITSDKNFPKDDFLEPDKIKAKNAFKSRALSFEYYINYIVLINKFQIKERPRVIYPFKSLNAILNKEIESDKYNNLVEIDGLILEKRGFDLTLEKNAFIIDELYKLEEFTTINREKIVEPYIEKVVDLKENELCIIEIKNQFPPSDTHVEQSDPKEKQPTTFYQMVKAMIKKAKIFKQLYDLKNEKIENIRLILFYDVIQKEKYYEDLKKAFKDSFKENDESQFLYEFQCIYIKSSYLAAGLFNMSDQYSFYSYKNKTVDNTINILKYENERLKEETSNLNKKILDLSEEVLKLKVELTEKDKKKLEENSMLIKIINDKSEETQKLKDEFLEETIKLKKEINNNSSNLMKLNKEFFNSNQKMSQEIIGLKEEMNKLTKEKIALQKEKLELEKKNQSLLNSKEEVPLFEKKLPKTEEFTKEKLHENKGLNEKPSKKEIIKSIMSDVLKSKISQEEGEKKLLELFGEI